MDMMANLQVYLKLSHYFIDLTFIRGVVYMSEGALDKTLLEQQWQEIGRGYF